MLRGLNLLAFSRIGCRENQPSVQSKRQSSRKKECHGQHMCRIIVEIPVLISNRGNPVEVGEYSIRKCMGPRTKQNWPDYNQRHVSQNCETEGDRYMIPHAQLSRDLDLT